jgi:hypothetical protein
MWRGLKWGGGIFDKGVGVVESSDNGAEWSVS